MATTAGKRIEEHAAQLGVALLGPPVESPMQEADYRLVVSAMAQERVDGVIVSDQLENVTYRRRIIELAVDARFPMVFPYREQFESGGLIAYGPSLANIYQRLAGYVDRILKGDRPSEMPIYLASKFELLMNLKTAKLLGLTVPPTLLARADEVL